MDPLLNIENLKVDFHMEEALVPCLKGVFLRLYAGETLVLAGESGSGKTLTSLAICGLLPANARISAGTIRFEDTDMLRAGPRKLAAVRGSRIAYIFQEPASYLNPVLSVGFQICEALIRHQRLSRRKAAEAARALLEQVRISDSKRVFASYPHQLSGGMNQRACIAMSLACRPRLLIADEPTTSLDVTIEKDILELLVELKRSMGFALLFITHNLSIARRIADRVCVMYDGRVVEDERTEAIFGLAKHRHTRELIEAYERIGRL